MGSPAQEVPGWGVSERQLGSEKGRACITGRQTRRKEQDDHTCRRGRQRAGDGWARVRVHVSSAPRVKSRWKQLASLVVSGLRQASVMMFVCVIQVSGVKYVDES